MNKTKRKQKEQNSEKDWLTFPFWTNLFLHCLLFVLAEIWNESVKKWSRYNEHGWKKHGDGGNAGEEEEEVAVEEEKEKEKEKDEEEDEEEDEER